MRNKKTKEAKYYKKANKLNNQYRKISDLDELDFLENLGAIDELDDIDDMDDMDEIDELDEMDDIDDTDDMDDTNRADDLGDMNGNDKSDNKEEISEDENKSEEESKKKDDIEDDYDDYYGDDEDADARDLYELDQYADHIDDFDEYDEPLIVKDKKTKKKKKKDKGIKGIILLLAWLVLILFGVIFYFYFWDKLPFNKEKKEPSTEETQIEITYETNAHPEINTLIEDYLVSMAACDQTTLKSLVIDETKFDDMTFYEKKREVINGYISINVYTLPGYFTGDYIAYATFDSVIVGIDTTMADIQSFYISASSDGYKINNTELEPEMVSYMNNLLNQPDIQALYEGVAKEVEACLETDPTFKAFYDNLTNNTTKE